MDLLISGQVIMSVCLPSSYSLSQFGTLLIKDYSRTDNTLSAPWTVLELHQTAEGQTLSWLPLLSHTSVATGPWEHMVVY